MGMTEFRQWYYRYHNPDYSDINNAPWFREIVEDACEHSERNGNRLYIYLPNKEAYDKAVKVCETRNISYIGPMTYVDSDTHRLDVLMNWKERRPSRLVRNKEQKLN